VESLLKRIKHLERMVIMENSHDRIVELLIGQGYKILKQPYEKIIFTENKVADDLLNNLKEFPHAFVLACIMDRQIGAERAWLIPYEISKELGDFSFPKLLQLNLNQIKKMFEKKKLHRFNSIMAENFYLAVQKIHEDYKDDASGIWKGNQRSGLIVRRFLRFKGAGVKIATMATNILARDFKIAMKDFNCIDVSPDRQVKKAFIRLGLVPKDAKNEELMYCARELNPNYPGVFDLPCWEIGKECDKPEDSNCKQCYLSSYCPKII
jgi:endonuclease III